MKPIQFKEKKLREKIYRGDVPELQELQILSKKDAIELLRYVLMTKK